MLSVGVNRYDDDAIAPLKSSVPDAADLFGLFRHRLGYQGHLLTDARADDLGDAFHRIGKEVRPGDAVLVYFVGHGIWAAEGPLLLLRNARAAVLSQSFAAEMPGVCSLRSALAQMASWQGVQRLMVLDTCLRLANARSRDLGEESSQVDGAHPVNGDTTVLATADANGVSVELTATGRGLFASALAAELTDGAQARTPRLVDHAFADAIAQRMTDLLASHALPMQPPRPRLLAITDPPFDLIPPAR